MLVPGNFEEEDTAYGQVWSDSDVPDHSKNCQFIQQ